MLLKTGKKTIMERLLLLFFTALPMLFAFCSTANSGDKFIPSEEQKRVVYDCPDLHNKAKQSISELFQGYDGWFFRENDLKMDFSLSPETYSYFERLNNALKDNGITLIFVPLLTRAMTAHTMVNPDDPWLANYDYEIALKSYSAFVKGLNSRGIKTVDLSVLMDNVYDKGDPYLYNFKYDIHWKPEGAKVVARAVAPLLKEYGEYDRLTKVKTTMTKGGEKGRYGRVVAELQKLCRGSFDAETYYEYNAKRDVEGNGEESLFGSDDQSVPVALLGTSFSAQDTLGFANYLEVFSNLEVSNFAIAGGEMYASIISYMSSPFFLKNKPPMIIWESQSVYNYNRAVENHFRQIIPAIYGHCSGDKLVTGKKLEITKDKSYRIFENLDDMKIHGSDYYFHIIVDNNGFRNFKLELEYDDLDGEMFPIKRNDRYNNKGHYFIELSDKIDSNLSYVSVSDTRGVTANMEVFLCRK